MRTSHRGFIVPLFLTVIAFLLIGGTFLYIHENKGNQTNISPITTTAQQNTKIVKTNVSTSSSLQSDSVVVWSDQFYKYISQNGYIYLNGEKIEGVDSKSFQIITQNPFPTGKYQGEGIAHYSKDKNKVFYDGKLIQGAGVSSFVVVWPDALGTEQVYAQDGNNVYYDGQVLVPKADATSFRPLSALGNSWRVGGNYSTDKNRIYYKTTEVVGADVGAFNSEYEDDYAADKNHVFFEGKIIANADPKNFVFPVHGP